MAGNRTITSAGVGGTIWVLSQVCRLICTSFEGDIILSEGDISP